jgi:hypothetical protein
MESLTLSVTRVSAGVVTGTSTSRIRPPMVGSRDAIEAVASKQETQLSGKALPAGRARLADFISAGCGQRVGKQAY